MNKQRTLQAVLLSLLLVLLFNITSLWAERSANYALADSVISNGGGSISAGKYQLSATIGQQTTGNSSGGDYTIIAGFWANANGMGGNKIFLPVVQR